MTARSAACCWSRPRPRSRCCAPAASACCAQSRRACSRPRASRARAGWGARRWKARSPTCNSRPMYLADERLRPDARLAGAAGIGLPSASRTRHGCRPDRVWPLAGILASGTSRRPAAFPDRHRRGIRSAGPDGRSQCHSRKRAATRRRRRARDRPRPAEIPRRLLPRFPRAACERSSAPPSPMPQGARLQQRRAEALEDLDRAKNAFFGDVSHELRTPITLILASLADALEGAPERRTRGSSWRSRRATRGGSPRWSTR